MTKEEILKKAEYYALYERSYQYVIEIFGFDHLTQAPINSLDEGNEAMSFVMNELYKELKSDDYIEFVKEAYKHKDEFSEEYKRLFELKYLELKKNENITPELNYEISLAFASANTKWEEAKEKNDFNIFKEPLRKVIEMTKKIIKLRDEKYDHPYDVLVNDYERGTSTKELDKFFSELKSRIVPLVDKINHSSKKIREDFLSRKVSKDIQEKLAYELLEFNKFDLKSGVLSESVHPFTTFPSHYDIRVTTHYYENMFASNIYSVIHEGGHGIFAQNEPNNYYVMGLAGHMTMGQHETISRFYENLVGRNIEYVKHVYKKLNNVCINLLKDVSFEEFYEGINLVKPSLIRTEADELTYSLHIMIRYEIEKALIEGSLDVDHVREKWNELYKEYLGVDVKSDREGILQDVHWSQGSIGYFPSYALGNAYGAQILNTMRKDIDVEKTLKNGDLNIIKEWLKEHVFKYGSLLDPKDWVVKITGEELNPKYYLDYLENKYKKLYNLK